MATRILIADDHLAVREGVRSMLELENDLRIVGEAADGREAARKALELQPDLIVLDNSMPGMTGLEVARDVAARLPDTAIVFLTLDPGIRDLALASGAVGYVSKDAAADEFLRVIRAAADALQVRRRLQGLPGSWRRMADLLIGQRSITPDQLDGIVLSRQGDEAIAATILRSGVIGEAELGQALSRASDRPLVSLAPFPEGTDPIDPRESRLAVRRFVDPIDVAAARRLPRRFCETRRCVLLTSGPDGGTLAMADPLDEETLRKAEDLLGEPALRVVTATANEVAEAIARAYDPSLRPTAVVTGGTGALIPTLVAMGAMVLVIAVGFFWFFHSSVRFETAFALVALACGMFFFAYALKYYITSLTVLALAIFGDKLTFAQKSGNGNGNDGGAHPNGNRHAKKLNGQPVSNGRPHTNGYKTLRGDRIDTEGTVITDPWAQIDVGSAWRLPQEKQPFVSVQVATYNERNVMDRLLTACTSFDYDNYEVLVCDDSTDPEAIRILDRWRQHPRIRVLHRSKRTGFKGGALHAGLQRMHPQAEYVIIFDADFVPPADIIWHFLEYFGRITPNGNGNGKAARGVAPAHGNGHGNGNGNGHAKYVNGVPVNGERIAAVQGYQWHMLNAGENWVTRGVRAEFAGSYVLERSGQELFGMMKMISGSVYMIRADVLRKFGWSTSITEDWELTIRLYLAGYKVLYTPYIQAPAECVSTIGRLVKQRMRWAEGHTFNVKKYFWPILRSPNLTFREKLEWVYFAPYYLQSVVFAVGTVAWLLAEIFFNQHIPNWGAVLGWSLVFTNVLALPLMNLAAITLEGSIKRDVGGILSFVGLSNLLVPFQAYAALKGLFETEEGGWVRTPKSGVITETFGRFRLARLLPWELPERRKRKQKRSVSAKVAVTGGMLLVAAGILGVGALSIRAAAGSGAATGADLAVIPGFLGTLVPLLLVAYAWFKLKRVGLIAFALFFAVSANLVFLANTIPADAAATTSRTFTFARTQAFDARFRDMKQSYTPTNVLGATCGGLASFTCTFVSDTFDAGWALNSGDTVAQLYLANSALTPCNITITLKRVSSTGVVQVLGSATTSVLNGGSTTLVATTFTTAAATFAAGDRLVFEVTQPASLTCAVVLYYDGLLLDSRITVPAIVVPEGVLGLLLVAPLIPLGIAWRRRRARAQ